MDPHQILHHCHLALTRFFRKDLENLIIVMSAWDRAALSHSSNWSQYNQNPVLPLPHEHVVGLMSTMRFTRDIYLHQYHFDSTVYTLESLNVEGITDTDIERLLCTA
ncbi:hypothetical protein RR48_15425 [Papilio machaon]|uniref:Uncharacterized protein n=1 Tax=Papilio machaon TaxID=76193 RepID=A0A194QVD6_PAPMA|nr:uncharacterized protein LOC123723478 [Papilio machaon]KPJ09284.1 hypothetical protein RR48_15425 [Papilio machaon]